MLWLLSTKTVVAVVGLLLSLLNDTEKATVDETTRLPSLVKIRADHGLMQLEKGEEEVGHGDRRLEDVCR